MNRSNEFEKAAIITSYPRVYPLSMRWTDLDADRYLSELAVSRYAEQGRSEILVRALNEVGIDSNNGPVGMLVASVRIAYISQRQVTGDIRLATGIARIGRTSVDLRIAVFDSTSCMAITDNVMVFTDRASGRPAPVPGPLVAKLEGLLCDLA